MSKPILLLPHPQTPSAIPTPWVMIGRDDEILRMTFRMPGDTSMVTLPEPIRAREKRVEERRADRLWEHTCFECFIRSDEGTGYFEFNFSPSMEWAAYRFDEYRTGMRPAEVDCPAVIATNPPNRFELSARVVVPEWKDRSWFLNLTAVIEEKSGRKSYWALNHPPEGPPDFHHPACFTLELPPAPAP